MKKIWFIKNMSHEEAGLFSKFAEELKIPSETVDLNKGDKFPDVPSDDALVILGGPDSANDRSLKILGEIESIKNCIGKGIPMLGVCLGLQLLVKAGGGSVYRNPVKEIGFRGPDGKWFELESTEEGIADPLLQGLGRTNKVFQLHGETVHLGPGMVLLAKGRFCENQIVKVAPKAYGIQGHIELNETMFRDWLVKDGNLKKMDAVKLRNDFSAAREDLGAVSRVFFSNFLKISGFLK